MTKKKTDKQERRSRWMREALAVTPQRLMAETIADKLEEAYQEGLKVGVPRVRLDPGPPVTDARGGFVDSSGKVNKSGKVD